MTIGALPPSSSSTGLRIARRRLGDDAADCVEPVKLMRRTAG